MNRLRQRILVACEEARPMFGMVDESLIGPCRVRGKRGPRAQGKTTVFGIFERAGLLKGKATRDAWTRLWPFSGRPFEGCGGSASDPGDHSPAERGMAKVRLAMVKELPQHIFHLHLKETE